MAQQQGKTRVVGRTSLLSVLALASFLVLAAGSSHASSPYPPGSVITAVSFDWLTHDERAPGSDNWPITWADDGHQYTSWGDGGGFGGTNSQGRVSLGVARIEGAWNTYQGFNVWGGENPENPAQFDGKSYGVLSVDGVLYMWWGPGSNGTFYNETRLVSSTDHGATWTKASWDWTTTDPDIISGTFLNFGQDYAGARDGFVYSYFIRKYSNGLSTHSGGSPATGKIDLARVPQGEILTQGSYEWYAGLDGGNQPLWTSDAVQRQPVFEDANGVGWNVSVSYNAPLQRYLLATEHSETFKGNMGLFDAPEPWGPWTTVTYFESPSFGSGGQGTTSFFWNFANKWLSADGKNFTMVFTGIGGDDSWNTIRGTFGASASSPVSCLEVKKLRARCNSRGKIVASLRLHDRTHTGERVRLSIDGILFRARIQGRRAKLSDCCYEAGAHTVGLEKPRGCLEPVELRCTSSALASP